MSRYVVNGVSLNAEVFGDGPSLLLLHGFTGSAATWQPYLPALTANHRLITLDLLGHGSSDAPDEPGRYDISNASADLARLLADLGLKQTSVLGYSLGGRIALYFALHHPELVSGLVLESASPGLADATERAIRVESDNTLADFVMDAGIAAFVERWEKLPMWDSQKRLPAQLRTDLHRQRLVNNPVGLANSLRGLGTGVQPSLWERLPELATPILLIAGALDVKFSGIAKQMAQRLPNSHLAIVPEAGHAVHLEQPAEFERLVKDFLA